MDLAQSLEGMKKLKEEYKAAGYGDNPVILYAAHYLGVPTLKQWLDGKELTPQQQQHVSEFKDILIPRIANFFKNDYNTIKV